MRAVDWLASHLAHISSWASGWVPRSDGRYANPGLSEVRELNWRYVRQNLFRPSGRAYRAVAPGTRAEDQSWASHRPHPSTGILDTGDGGHASPRPNGSPGTCSHQPGSEELRVYGHDLLKAYRQWPVRATFLPSASGVTLWFHLAMCFGAAALFGSGRFSGSPSSM